MKASPNSLKLAGQLVKYNPNFISNDDDDFEDLPDFGCDLGHATHKSVEAMQNTPSEGKQNIPVDRRTRSHSETPSDRVTRSHTAHHVVVEKGTSYKRKIKIVGKDVVKDKGKGSKRKAKSDRDDVPSKKRKVHVDQNLWDYYVPLDDHYSTRISVHTNCSIVKYLKDNLDDQQIEMFRRTCFGYFVDLPEFFIQNQLIHSLLIREVVSPKDNELWTKVNSTKLRFGLVEFCIITGLKCNGDPNKDYELRFLPIYTIYQTLLPSMFKKIYGRTDEDEDEEHKSPFRLITGASVACMWKSDEDALKIVVLYFNFLFSITNDYLITKNDFLLVESGDFETFPWGKMVFNATLESMKDKLVFDNNEIHIESGVVAEVKTKKHSKDKPESQSINNENPDPQSSNLNSSEKELKLLRSEIKKVNDKVSSLENLMISSFEKVFKALGNQKDDNHYDKEVSENNFGSEEVMEKNIGIEEVVKKNVDNEVSLEQTVDVMEGVVKDSIQDGKSSEGVGDDEAWIEDAEPEITAITQQFCDKNTANIGSLVDDSVQLGKNSCEEVGEDNSWSSDAEAQITAITQKYFNQNIVHGDYLGVEKNIATMQEDHIVVVDHDTPEMNPRERKPAGVMKSPFINTFDFGGTIQVVENKPTKSKKPILTIKYPFEGNVDNHVDFRHIDVIFYYLRKKGKYGVDVPVRFTTNNCWFNCLISNLYKEFLEKNRDMNLITETDPIVEYILGYFLICNVPWSTVDEIFFPINLSDKWHWILARLSFKDLCIYENPMGIPANDPFEIHVVDGLPTQDNTDCGIYVAAFAEYIIQGSCIPKAIILMGYRTDMIEGSDKKDNKKKSKSHSVVDDKSLKDNKKKGKTHAVCDDKTLKDIKKKSKLHDVGDGETLKDIKKKAFAFSTDFANLAGVAKLLQEVL
ncbi:uncharacterized protein [Nicotiana sylvestris]|uniref:uncharacterized protein n=1 Tax=Nicotiana sylvestris TaxID=4096 RepID=UPI00388C97E5